MRNKYIIIVLLSFCYLNLFAESPYSINQNRNNLQGLNFVNKNIGWVFNVQEHTTELLKTVDGGENWKVQKIFNDFEIINNKNIKFFDEQNGYALFYDYLYKNRLFATTDGGDNWNEIKIPINKGNISIHYYNKDIFWLSCIGLYKTIDGGKNWFKTHDNTLEFESIQFFGLMKGWALHNNQLIITEDAGMTWKFSLENVFDFKLIDERTGFCMKQGSLFRTDDFGSSWQFIMKYSYEEPIIFLSKNIAYRMTENGLERTGNGGFKWNLNLSGKLVRDISYMCYNSMELSKISDSEYYILYDRNYLLKTTNSGLKWDINQSGTNSNLIDIKGIDSLKLIVAGENGIIGRTTDGGANWDFRNDITEHKLNKIQIIDNTVYIQGDSAVFLKSTDFGENWKIIKLPDDYIYRGIFEIYPENDGFHFINKDTGWLVGKGGIAFKTTNGGDSFELVKIDAYDLWDVFFIDEKIGFMLVKQKYSEYPGYKHLLMMTQDGGVTWQKNENLMGSRFLYYSMGMLWINSGGYPVKYDIKKNDFIEIRPPHNHYYDIDGLYMIDSNTIWGWNILNATCSFYKITNGGKNWDNISNCCKIPSSMYFIDNKNGWMVIENEIIKTNNGGYYSFKNPILKYPNNNSTISEDSLYFLYKEQSCLERSELQFSEDSTFNLNIDDFYRKKELYKKYYWRMRIFDADGKNVSEWSDIWNFYIKWSKKTNVYLISPKNNDVVKLEMDLSWDKLRYAEYYRVQLSGDSAFKTIIMDSITTSDVIKKYNFLKADGTYYWRVKAYNSQDSTKWSETGKFKCLIVNVIDKELQGEEIIFPNPAKDFLTINLNPSEGLKPSEGSVVEIYNGFGELVLKDVPHLQDVAHLKRIDISQLPAGLYFVKIDNKVEKFVKF